MILRRHLLPKTSIHLFRSLTLWARPICRKTSWSDPSLLWTTLPRYVKLVKISMFSPLTWIDCTVSPSKPLNTWTFVLGLETWSPKGFASSSSVSISHHQNLQWLSEEYCIVSKIKISDLGIADSCSTVTLVHNSAQYPVHTCIEKSWSKDATLPHSRMHRKEAGHSQSRSTGKLVDY